MANPRSILRVGAIGATWATVMLILLLFVPWPLDVTFPGEEVLAGKMQLSSEDLAQYTNFFGVFLAIDGLFVIGWIVGWVGIAFLVRARSPWLGVVVLVTGLVPALLDLAENEIMWAMIQGYQLDFPPQPSWFTAWKISRQLSYWIFYAAAALAGLGLWSDRLLDRLVTIVGTVLMAVVTPSLYLGSLPVAASAWFLVWFACTSVLLWRRATEWPAAERTPPARKGRAGQEATSTTGE